MDSINIKELNDRIQRESSFVDILTMEMNKVIVGQKHLVENLLIGLLANGHILLEGVPGLAKTLAINTLSQAVNSKFSRIQFTPDLLPADVLGTLIYSQKTEQFQIKKGPIFANFVLADEINRSPAKVQSALLEGVPGLAKTLAINTLSQAVDSKFNRIQFTPDLLPADVLGTLIYSQKTEQFQIKKGPVFANFVLADEINRSPAKVQSALLEAMQERQVTIGEETFKLPEPFLVMATQNPIEQEGTYPLPEAQLDRFMLKVVVTYPKKEEERQIIRMNNTGTFPKAQPVLKPEDIVRAREVVKDVYMDEKIERYIVDIVYATRTPQDYGLGKIANFISYGASPRASISLAMASKAYAFIKRRGYVIPEDVRAVCYEVLRHRIGLTYEAEAENMTTDQIISEIINAVEVP